MGAGFFTRVKIANVLGRELFGEFTYALAIGSFVNVFVSFGIDKTLVRDLVHLPENFDELAIGSIIIRFINFSLIVLPLMILWHLKAPEEISFGILLIVLSFGILPLHLQAVFDVLGKIKLHAYFNLIQRSTYYCLIWLMILFLPNFFNLIYIGIISVLASILFFVFQIWWFYHNIDIGEKITRSVCKILGFLYKRNALIFFTSIVGLVLGYSNQIILKKMCGSAELGGYGVAWQIVTLANILIMQVVRIGRPKTAEITKSEVARNHKIKFLLKYSLLMLLLGFLIGLPAVIFPRNIISLLFDQQYLFAVNILRVMGAYVTIIAIEPVMSQYIIFSGMEKLYFVSSAISGVLSVCLCVLLIPSLAGYGAALSLLIAQFCALLIMVIGICISLRPRCCIGN